MSFRFARPFAPALVFLVVGCDVARSSPRPVDEAPVVEHSDGLLVEDFEDGDLRNAFDSEWTLYSDADEGGGSRLDSMPWVVEGGYQSSHKARLDFTLEKRSYAYSPYLGIATEVPKDAAAYAGLSYVYRGPAHLVQLLTTDVADFDYFRFEVPASASWKKVVIGYQQAHQAGFGTAAPWNPENLEGISWSVTGADGLTGTLELDDMYLERTVEVDRGPADWTVQPVAPPALVELDSLSIPGALQTKALAELNRGYNITNWLEESTFSSFEYDEAYIEHLAAAGFKALRLPIDLDRYIAHESGAGDALELELNEDLFTVLDSFDAWTVKHGLSFTIDYHQYDASLDLMDPASVDRLVALWRAVAEHFATNPRSDLYYELMNEPELASGATVMLPTAPWTAAAERAIAAIRSRDAEHTVIFGDVNWYGIDTLSRRTPFADENIVYAFHFYDPFIFTHQGASWVEMASTQGIPYPYTPERWSDHASDLGLTKAQPTWIWSLFRNYNAGGTRAALFNRIAQAKRWAVAQGVPVICNEFGAYDATSLPEDRLRYYTDLIGIFEELEIPWQHWFMNLDADGTIAPDVAEAFHLEP
jgi:endoglucanase